jgi:hypothetical protein
MEGLDYVPQKRIAAGGWFEEIWYSHYMIGQCYLQLNNPIRSVEEWMLRAYEFRASTRRK